jgi:hypothetical protein
VSGGGTMLLEKLAAPTAANSVQPRAALGTFVCPANPTSPASYTNVPLTDFFGNPVVVQLNGTNTLRATSLGGGYDLNYLIFLPATNTAPLAPCLASGYPYPGASGVAANATVTFTIANRASAVAPSSIRLFLNGAEVTGAIVLSNNAAGTLVSYAVSPLLPANSTNTLQAIFSDGSVWQTNHWQFTVTNLVPVQLVNPAWQGGRFAFSFQAAGGHTNTVQFKNHLTDAVWQTLTNFPGLGVPTTVTDPFATNSTRFYRVVTE